MFNFLFALHDMKKRGGMHCFLLSCFRKRFVFFFFCYYFGFVNNRSVEKDGEEKSEGEIKSLALYVTVCGSHH